MAGQRPPRALPDRPRAGDPERQGRPDRRLSTTTTTAPSGPPWSSSATSIRRRMEAKIKAGFGDWRGQGPAGADPDLGKVATARRRFPGWRSSPARPTTFELAWVDAAGPVARRRWPSAGARSIERLGLAVLNRRLATLAREDSAAVHRRRRLPRRPAAGRAGDRLAGLRRNPTTGRPRSRPPRPRRAARSSSACARTSCTARSPRATRP